MAILSDINRTTSANAEVIVAELVDSNGSAVSIAVDYTDYMVRIANAAERILDNVYKTRVAVERMNANIAIMTNNIVSINASVGSIATDIDTLAKEITILRKVSTTETLGLVSRGTCIDYMCAETQALFNTSLDDADFAASYKKNLETANTSFSYSGAIDNIVNNP